MDVLLDVATAPGFISDGTGFADLMSMAPTARPDLADRAIC